MSKLKLEILKTKNYILRELIDEDLQDIYLYRSNIDLANIEGREVDREIETTLAYLNRIKTGIENKQWLYWIIADSNNLFLGSVSL